MNRNWINPANLSLALIAAFFILLLAKLDWEPLELAQIGTQYAEADPSGTEGYDGQFNYYIARNPRPAQLGELLDVPAYRYQRVLYPVLAWVLSFGQVAWLPWLLPLILLSAHYLAVRKLSQLLIRWGSNPWHALAYALWVGFTLAIRLDLTEPLAFGLIIFAISAHYEGRDKRAWIFYLAAVFAKETMLIFVIGQLLAYLWKRRWKDIVSITAFVLIPYAAFQFWLLGVFGRFGIGSGGIRATPFEWVPFNGIWGIAEYDIGLMLVFLALYLPLVILPSVLGLWSSLLAARTRGVELVTVNLLLGSLLMLVLPHSLYREPIGALRMLTVLLIAWLLFGSRFNISRAPRYALLGISLNFILVSELFAT